MKEIRTKNIQFAAFLLSRIPSATFHIKRSSNNDRSIILVLFPTGLERFVAELTDQFYRCEATIHLFSFNRKLNVIRDTLKNEAL
ncbi:MAG: hypothetical protein WC530_00455 [Candidatus Omnitrophota bacterium]|jgi:hypothetical protein